MSLTTTRTGVLGGTFDPPHNGHVELARSAIEGLSLQQCRIIPAGEPYHRGPTVESAQTRVQLARLAFQGVPHCIVDDREARNASPGYTVDTLQALHAEMPDASLILIIGIDAFLGFPQWHQWIRIFDLAHVAVTQRADTRIDVLHMNPALADEFSARYTEDLSVLSRQPAGRIVRLEMRPMPVSATEVRRLLASHTAADMETARSLLPSAVLDYIESNNLYRRPA